MQPDQGTMQPGSLVTAGGPRFSVHELRGHEIRTIGAGGGHSVEGLTVTVLDSAYCYRVVETWRSEQRTFDRDDRGRWYAHSRVKRFANMRQEAQALADRLNAMEQVDPARR